MSKYSKIMIKRCAEWVIENGLIDYGGAKMIEFCRFFHIDDMTYYRWMKKSEFSEAIKKAKDKYKENISKDVFISMAKSAMGYNYTQTTTEYVDVNGKPKIKKQTKIEKHVEPNVTACIFLLKNLDPEHFKDIQRQEITGKDGESVNTKNVFNGFNFLPYTQEAESIKNKS